MIVAIFIDLIANMIINYLQYLYYNVKQNIFYDYTMRLEVETTLFILIYFKYLSHFFWLSN